MYWPTTRTCTWAGLPCRRRAGAAIAGVGRLGHRMSFLRLSMLAGWLARPVCRCILPSRPRSRRSRPRSAVLAQALELALDDRGPPRSAGARVHAAPCASVAAWNAPTSPAPAAAVAYTSPARHQLPDRRHQQQERQRIADQPRRDQQAPASTRNAPSSTAATGGWPSSTASCISPQRRQALCAPGHGRPECPCRPRCAIVAQNPISCPVLMSSASSTSGRATRMQTKHNAQHWLFLRVFRPD